jgi:hypothetical protein
MSDLKFTTCGDYMDSATEEKYVVVTTTSTFRQRYCIPVSKLQEMNSTVSLKDHPEQIVPWAEDSVTSEDVKEFSQKWLGETILDTFILDEERVLMMFDRDNGYLSKWTKEQKLDFIDDWKEKPVAP